MQIALSRIICAGFALTFLAEGNGAHERPVPTVSVDLPHGGCRLTIRKDGEASIHYGAMPRWVRVTPGTFDFDQIVPLLRANSYPPSDRPSQNESVATLSLPESQNLRLINDVALVRSLLERAWKARAAPMEPSDDEDYRWVARACSFS